MNRTGTASAGTPGDPPERLFDKAFFPFDRPRAANPMRRLHNPVVMNPEGRDCECADTETIGRVHVAALPGHESELEPSPDREPLYPGSGRLKDKVALITGADSGIGRATGGAGPPPAQGI